MKLLQIIVLGLGLLLANACNPFLPVSENPNSLSLTLETTQKEFSSFEDVQFELHLTNESHSSLLVHRRLSYLPFPVDPLAIEMFILITDSSGNLIANETLHPNYDWPSEDSLGALRPGEAIKKIIYLDSVGFYARMFDEGEKYTIVAVYQNELDMSKTIKGVVIPAWVGTIRSNEETFIILSPE